MFTWTALPGRTYQLLYSSDLNQSTWSNLGPPVTTTGNVGNAYDTIGSDRQRLYRVELLP